MATATHNFKWVKITDGIVNQLVIYSFIHSFNFKFYANINNMLLIYSFRISASYISFSYNNIQGVFRAFNF